IAFAWIRDESDGTYLHSGLISGYTSYAFFRPQGDYAGIVLFNTLAEALPFVDQVGEHVRQRLAGAPAASLASITVPANGGIRHDHSRVLHAAHYGYTRLPVGGPRHWTAFMVALVLVPRIDATTARLAGVALA